MKPIVLKSITIKNYRTIRDCHIDFSEGVAGLIGVNGSGKTNVWRAISFFFRMIREHINKRESSIFASNTPLTSLKWTPLNDDYRAIFPSSQKDQKTSFKLTASLFKDMVLSQVSIPLANEEQCALELGCVMLTKD